MPTTIDLLSPNLGIQSVLEMPNGPELPKARELASSSLNDTGLDALFAPANISTATEALLCPQVGDGTCLSPETFAASLRSCASALGESSLTEVNAMVSEELEPLLKNSQLLQAYIGLMIGG